jgi:hypothetical protein
MNLKLSFNYLRISILTVCNCIVLTYFIFLRTLIFLTYFLYFEKKIKVGLWDHHSLCVSVCLLISLINFRMPEPVFMKLDAYARMNVVCMSWHLSPSQRLLHKSLPSVCVSVCSPIVARQRLGKNVTAATNMQETLEELLNAPFLYDPCLIKESRRLVLPRAFCLELLRFNLNIFYCSNTGIVSSNPTRNMGVCPRFSCVCVILLSWPWDGLIPRSSGSVKCLRVSYIWPLG